MFAKYPRTIYSNVDYKYLEKSPPVDLGWLKAALNLQEETFENVLKYMSRYLMEGPLQAVVVLL